MTTANRDLPNGLPEPAATPAAAKLLMVGEGFGAPTRLFAEDAGRTFCELAQIAEIPIRKCRFAEPAAELVPALESSPVQWVILSGDAALHTVRPDLDQRFAHGRPIHRAGITFMPVFHHVALYRHPQWRALVAAELGDLVTIAKTGNWMRFVPDTCVKCRGEFYRVDDEGIVYCEAHWRA